MARDPLGEGYDAWKTTDRDQERRERDYEWMRENTTYELACCGKTVELDDDFVDGETYLMCPQCKEMSEVYEILPDEDDRQDCENGGDGDDD